MVSYSFRIHSQILSGLTPTPACEGQGMLPISHMRRLEIKRLAQGHAAHWWSLTNYKPRRPGSKAFEVFLLTTLTIIEEAGLRSAEAAPDVLYHHTHPLLQGNDQPPVYLKIAEDVSKDANIGDSRWPEA